MTLGRRIRLMVRLVLCLIAPVYLSWLAAWMGPEASVHPVVTWLPVARVALWLVVFLTTLSTLYLERVLKGPAASQVRARGQEPDEAAFGLALALGITGPLLAFVLVMLGGEPADLYAASAIAVASAVFWAWRHRVVVRSLVVRSA